MNTTSPLAEFLARLSWSPERLAREINRKHGVGTISSKAPYNWLKGARPRGQLPNKVAFLLAARLGEPITARTLWPENPSPAAGAPGRPSGGRGRELPLIVLDMLATRVRRLRQLRENGQHELAGDWVVQDLRLARKLAAEYTCDASVRSRLHGIIEELDDHTRTNSHNI